MAKFEKIIEPSGHTVSDTHTHQYFSLSLSLICLTNTLSLSLSLSRTPFVFALMALMMTSVKTILRLE